MSIIGPRASEWDAVNTFLPDEIDKMKVRPGITGLSQAYYRNSVSPRKKRLLDAFFLWIRNKWTTDTGAQFDKDNTDLYSCGSRNSGGDTAEKAPAE